MSTTVLADTGSGVINLDQPGTYLHWSIFTVSVANLVLIAVMVIIFAVALLLPFPKARTYPPAEELPAGADPGTLAGAPRPTTNRIASFSPSVTGRVWGKTGARTAGGAGAVLPFECSSSGHGCLSRQRTATNLA